MHNSPDFEGGEKAMIDLLSYNSNLTAVVAYNDTMAAGAISVLNETISKSRNNFPLWDLMIMPIARYLIPKLTTVRYPIDLMANYAAKLALSLVDSSIVTPTVVQFNPTLVRRFFRRKCNKNRDGDHKFKHCYVIVFIYVSLITD